VDVARLVVALATVPDKAIWVLVLYLGIQLLENNLLVPKIQSAYLRIHPAIMIVLLVIAKTGNTSTTVIILTCIIGLIGFPFTS